MSNKKGAVRLTGQTELMQCVHLVWIITHISQP